MSTLNVRCTTTGAANPVMSFPCGLEQTGCADSGGPRAERNVELPLGFQNQIGWVSPHGVPVPGLDG